MTVENGKDINGYVKALLYACPYLNGLSEALMQSAQNKALLSYKKPDAFAAAQGVAGEILLCEAVERVARDIEKVLRGLSAQERYLISYKYFHREQEEGALDCAERSYYRKQKALLAKTGALLRAEGWTEEKFLREFQTSTFFMRIYKAICEGRERELVRKRTRKTLRTVQTKSSLSSRKTV